MSSVSRLPQRDVILFDLDGTLIDTAADMFRAMNITLQQLGYPLVTEQQIREWVGQGTSKLCDRVLMHLQGEIDPAQHQCLLEKYLEVYEIELCVESQLFAGVLPFLEYCQSQQLHMACVTNKPEHLAKILLEKLDVNNFFGLVVGGDTLEKRKPDPMPLLHAMDFFQTQPEKTLMIGDSSNDVEAARRAGVDCVVMSYGYNHGEDISACQPQQVIDTLEALIV
ncbi:phosphoglycolate phosphatase [Acinetobacter brisouii]|jgi:phosphoglycolate phosphatase|uniref:phosphoglycolate phosphatase n=1 Tax=Acinetobacter brisouii TaxID=396323 RepID=UPI0012508343|nr:phosphoglycolate phosphatase [Acinetobacter brisouii]